MKKADIESPACWFCSVHWESGTVTMESFPLDTGAFDCVLELMVAAAGSRYGASLND